MQTHTQTAPQSRARLHTYTAFEPVRMPGYPPPVHIIHELIESQIDVRPASLRTYVERGANVEWEGC